MRANYPNKFSYSLSIFLINPKPINWPGCEALTS
jgi:hypothetical protein